MKRNYKINTIKLLSLFFLLTINVKLFAQYQIKLNVSNITETSVQIRGVLFDDKNYLAKDTLDFAKKQFNSSSKTAIIGGLYYLYFPVSKTKIYFALENKDTIAINISGKDYLASVKSNKVRNNVFFDYQRLERSYNWLDSAYAKEIRLQKKYNFKQRAEFFAEKTKALSDFRKKALLSIPANNVLHLYFKTLNQLDEWIPDRKNFEGRASFLKKFDLNSKKILFTPVLKEVLYEYYSSFPLVSDSLMKAMDQVLTLANCKEKAYPFIFDYSSKIVSNRAILNNGKSYVYVIEKYGINSPCKFLDKNSVSYYKKELDKLKMQNSKLKAPNIILPDTLKHTQNLHEFAKQYDFTVLIFYAPSCEHCQKEIPIMEETITNLEKQFNKRIGRFAICNDLDSNDEDWSKFIRTHKLNTNYAHVNLPKESKLRELYDAFSTPIYFLIDSDSDFLARRISPVSIKRYFLTL